MFVHESNTTNYCSYAYLPYIASRHVMAWSHVGVADVNEKLRVCDRCGAFLSIYDSDK